MSKILEQYAQTHYIGQSSTATQAQYLTGVAQKQNPQVPEDLYEPFTFQQWLQRNVGIIPNRTESQYSEYLRRWYANQFSQVNRTQLISQDYTQLLNSLRLLFDDSELERFKDVNFDNEHEVRMSIPVFASKLKEIALYYVQKRQSIKRAKLKYNMVGTAEAIEKVIYEHLLKTYTDRPMSSLSNPEITIPQLQDVIPEFNIQVNELFDTTDYLARTPDKVDQYIAEDQDNPAWLIYSNFIKRTTNNPLAFVLGDYVAQLVEDGYIDDIDLDRIEQRINNEALLAQKYLGRDLYYTQGFDATAVQPQCFPINITSGSNVFYWPNGEIEQDIVTDKLETISIQQSPFVPENGAVAGQTLDDADSMWVMTSNTLKGAWLQNLSDVSVEDTMKIKIDGRSTVKFKWPYAFKGITTGNQWSGPSFSSIDQTPYDSDPQATSQSYWSSSPLASAVEFVSIHDSTLVEDGAFGGPTYCGSDRIEIRPLSRDVSDDGSYTEVTQSAWLHQPLYTQLPVCDAITNIYWPLFTEQVTTTPPFEDPPPFKITPDDVEPINLTDVDMAVAFRGAVAGQDIDSGDIIWKFDPDGCDDQPIEGAILIGCEIAPIVSEVAPQIRADYQDGTIQSGIYFRGQVGFTRFVYDQLSTERVDINDIPAFTGFEHQQQCPYVTNNKVALKQQCQQWEQCDCKAVHYSPLGQKSSEYDDHKRLTDVVMVDTQWPEQPDPDTWVDEFGFSFEDSSQFAFFVLDDTAVEYDSGWNKGRWVTNTGQPFVFEFGKQYVYWRKTACCEDEGPDIVINHTYCELCRGLDSVICPARCVDPFGGPVTVDVCDCDDLQSCCRPVWRELEKVDEDTWQVNIEASPMVLNGGDRLQYIHRQTRNVTIDGVIMAIDSPSFIITANLNNMRPYWAGNNSSNLGGCGNTISYQSPCQYLFTTQPVPSTILLADSTYVEYTRVVDSPMIWQQPITVRTTQDAFEWKKIDIDVDYIDQLKTYLLHGNCFSCPTAETDLCFDTTVADEILRYQQQCDVKYPLYTLSDDPSDIDFANDPTCGIFTKVSYCSKQSYSTEACLTNLTEVAQLQQQVNIEPFLTADQPLAHINNTLWPTIASAPQLGDNLVSGGQLGLFTGTRTGVVILNSDQFSIILKSPLPLVDGGYVFNDPSVYFTSDNCCIENGQSALQLQSYNSTWFKQSPTAGSRSGFAQSKYQDFVPYSTKEQLHGSDYRGVDPEHYDSPWTGPLADQWREPDKYPAEFRRLYTHCCSVSSWENLQQRIPANHVICHWDTDVYGNQYALIKPDIKITNTCHISKEYARGGQVWARLANGQSGQLEDVMPDTIEPWRSRSPAVHNALISDDKILLYDVFYDVRLMHIDGIIAIDKIRIDQQGHPFVLVDDTKVIELASGEHYGGHWFNPIQKLIYISIVGGNPVTPRIIEVQIEDVQLFDIYASPSNDLSCWFDQVNMVSVVPSPQLTFNEQTQQLVVTIAGMREVGQELSFAVVNAYFSLSSTPATLINIDVFTDSQMIP